MWGDVHAKCARTVQTLSFSCRGLKKRTEGKNNVWTNEKLKCLGNTAEVSKKNNKRIPINGDFYLISQCCYGAKATKASKQKISLSKWAFHLRPLKFPSRRSQHFLFSLQSQFVVAFSGEWTRCVLNHASPTDFLFLFFFLILENLEGSSTVCTEAGLM